MIRKKYIYSLAFFCCFLSLSTELSAQLNFSVGLASGRTTASNLDNIITTFNNSIDYEEDLSSLRWLNGVNLGFRQRYDDLAIFVKWTNLRRSKSGYGADSLNELIEKELKYSMNTYEFGIENHQGIFAYGVSLGRRSLSIKTPIASSDRDRTITNDNHWISRFHCSVSSNGGAFSSIALMPYFEFAWQGTDLSGLNNELNMPGPNLTDRFHVFGISIIFFNGPQ